MELEKGQTAGSHQICQQHVSFDRFILSTKTARVVSAALPVGILGGCANVRNAPIPQNLGTFFFFFFF